ncbi:MAG: hypothetical protein LHW45_05085 [Candidatus Cloacimonetes bacterium]|nr:hypothetical protein [Candidatus Cloacimonadota bacterium]MDY0366986.1 P-loop NTPase fold protein [Candidatus Syntrophosphaera sp.]
MDIFDTPITGPGQDTLGRKETARKFADLILTWKHPHSMSILLNGPWGCGKTSFINLLKSYLNDKTKARDKKSHRRGGTLVFEFNPWFYTNSSDDLIPAFFEQLAANLTSSHHNTYRLSQDFLVYGKTLSQQPLLNTIQIVGFVISIFAFFVSLNIFRIIPYPPIWAGWIIIGLGAVASIYLIIEFIAFIVRVGSPVSKLNDKISKALDKPDSRIIVILDDIDRLEVAEIKSVLRLLRICAELPNCVFVMACDSEIVQKCLSVADYGVDGHEYLKKIVQLWIDIPLIREGQLEELFNYEFDEIVKGHNITNIQKQYHEDMTHWGFMIRDGFFDLFHNLRDVKGVLNLIGLNIPKFVVNGFLNVSIHDFTVIEAIKYFSPSYHRYIRNHKYFYTGSNPPGQIVIDETAKNEENKDINKQAEDVLSTSTNANIIQKLVWRMFPELGKYRNDFDRSPYVDLDEMDHKQRVCHPNHFDKYFTWDIFSVGDRIMLADIHEILQSKSLDTVTDVFTRHLGDNLLVKLIKRLMSEIKKSIDYTQSSLNIILLTAFNLSDTTPDIQEDSLDFDAKWYLGFLVDLVLEKIEQPNRLKAIINAIKETTGVYGPVHLTNSLLDDRKKDPYVVPLVTPDEIQEVKKEAISLITRHASILFGLRDFPFIYNCWVDWDDSRSWKAFIEDIYKDKDKLIMLVSRMKSRRFINGEEQEFRFSIEDLSKHYDVKLINNRLMSIKDNDHSLYISNQEMIDIYLRDHQSYDSSTVKK